MIQENCIEFLATDKTATITLTKTRLIHRVQKIAETREECEIVEQPKNNGGVLVAHVPVEWVKINPTRKVSESERARLSELARNTLHKGTTGR